MERFKRALALYIKYFLLRRTPTLVFSMERSGSVALLHSLQSHGVFAIGAHYLAPERLAQQRHSGSAGWASKYIIGQQKPAKVISLVRSPIENMLSTFAREDFGKKAHLQADAAERVSADDLSVQFCRDYLQTDRYLQPLAWFETEFQVALGIDLFGHKFDKQQGAVRFQEGPYEVLIMRTELEESLKAALVADFVGIPNLKISNAALASETSASVKRRLPPGKPGDQTDYAAKYKALKEHLVIPPEYLDVIVDSRYVQHFFTLEEREAMKLKYSR
ncbi:MAG: putative capsular polysaccharide synthesis family protein [Bythopirellula sp.]